jgi:hypothetical protein
MFDQTALNDIQVSNKRSSSFTLPPPGNYTVQLIGVGPSFTASGSIRKEFGKPLFEVSELTIVGPGNITARDYKLWQRLPMTDTVEYDRKVNYLRDLVRAYDDTAEFSNATEAFELITGFVEDGKFINVRLHYFAEDYKGAKAQKEAEGLNVPYTQLTDEQNKRRNEIDRISKVRGVKPFTDEDGNFITSWTSPFGNVIPVRLNIARFFNSSYDPFQA